MMFPALTRVKPHAWAAILVVAALTAVAVTVISGTIPLKAAAHVSRDHILIGDTIRYALVLDARRDVTVEPPDLDKYFASFPIRDKKRSVEDIRGRRVYRYTYFITKEDAGTYTIPPLVVRYKTAGGSVWSERSLGGYTIMVRGLLGADMPHTKTITIGGGLGGKLPRGVSGEDGEGGRSLEVDAAFQYDIKEVGGPKNILTVQDIIFIILSVAAVLIGLVVGISFLYEKAFKKQAPQPPIDAVALERLHALKPAAAVGSGAAKDLCFALSHILKEYLKARYGMEALEKTSREFIVELDAVPGVSADQRAAVRAVLTACDLVKYADVVPTSTELESAVASAKRLIEETKVVHDV